MQINVGPNPTSTIIHLLSHHPNTPHQVEMCSKCKTKVNTTIEMNLYPVRKIPAVGSIYYPLYIYIPSHHTLNPTPKISKLYMSDVGVSIEDAREVARRSERAEALA